MPDRLESLTFTWADLESWYKRGLIGGEQLEAIRETIVAGESGFEARPALVEQRRGLNLVTVAYYFGGFLILIAYTIYAAQRWSKLSPWEEVAFSAFPISVLWALGYLLRRSGFSLAGSILIFVGTGVIPLLAYSLEQVAGLWPPPPAYGYSFPGDATLARPMLTAWIYLECASLVAAVATLRLLRFPLTTVLIGFWVWFLALDLERFAAGHRSGFWDEPEWIVGIAIGLAVLGIGYLLDRRGWKGYSIWLYLGGHLLVYANFSPLAFKRGEIPALLYILLYVGFVVASTLLQRRVFLVFGALGSYSYATYLALNVFKGELGAAYAMAAVGLLIVLSAVGYQRYLRGRLERWVGVGPPAD